MKNIIAVSIIGFTALVACGDKKTVEKDSEVTKVDVAPVRQGDLKIAFYVQDSLVKDFKYYAQKDKVFRNKQTAFQKDIETRTRSYEQWVQRNAERYEAKTLTPEELGAFEQERPRREQAIMQYQQTRGAELDKESNDLLVKITGMIKKAGEKFSEENKIDILLTHGDGGQMNFINKKMDVTKEFINYLNKYQEDIERDLKPQK
jgi:Skp family chaperone for outer membrane proteins